jgi:hypothetical protein
MALKPFDPPWDYLRQASAASLQSFELSRLNHAANLRHEIATLMDQWLEETSQAMLARWLLENRDQVSEPDTVETVSENPLPDALPPAALPKLVRAVRGKSHIAHGRA